MIMRDSKRPIKFRNTLYAIPFEFIAYTYEQLNDKIREDIMSHYSALKYFDFHLFYSSDYVHADNWAPHGRFIPAADSLEFTGPELFRNYREAYYAAVISGLNAHLIHGCAYCDELVTGHSGGRYRVFRESELGLWASFFPSAIYATNSGLLGKATLCAPSISKARAYADNIAKLKKMIRALALYRSLH